MIKFFLCLVLLFLFSCSYENKNIGHNSELLVNRDSLLIDSLIVNENFLIAAKRIDSLLLFRVNVANGYYYYQKGFCLMMVESYDEALLNFQESKHLGYNTKACEVMIATTVDLKNTREKYDKKAGISMERL